MKLTHFERFLIPFFQKYNTQNFRCVTQNTATGAPFFMSQKLAFPPFVSTVRAHLSFFTKLLTLTYIN